MSGNVNIRLHKDVKYIIEKLQEAGYEAFVVGGAVRDFLLGNEPSDYDLTTSALPEKVKEVFCGERTLDTGIKHGTVTLLYNGKPYEITTYRLDGEYLDNRHPARIEFTASIEEDLARRDFTVNAMAYSDRRGLIDLFGGADDLKRGVIRAVFEPSLRFREDALRILRALRFAATLDFEIDEATRVAILGEFYRLSEVSRERVYAELKKLMSGSGAHRIITEFGEKIKTLLVGVRKITLPPPSVFDGFSLLKRVICVFYLSAEEPALGFSSTMRELKSDRRTELFGKSVLTVMRRTVSGDNLYEMISSEGIEAVRCALEIKAELCPEGREELCRLSPFLFEGVPTVLSELSVGGKDAVALGAVGTRVGELLKIALFAVMRGDVPNERTALLEYLKSKL